MLLNNHLSVHGDGKWEKVYSQDAALAKRVSARIEAKYQGYRSVLLLIFGVLMPVVFEYYQWRTMR